MTKTPQNNTLLSSLIAKGVAMAVILLIIVAPIMLIVILGLFAVFSVDSPIQDFVSEHVTLVAFLVVFSVIAATITVIPLIDKKIRRK